MSLKFLRLGCTCQNLVLQLLGLHTNTITLLKTIAPKNDNMPANDFFICHASNLNIHFQGHAAI